jgi:hypothetical protein
MKNQTGIDTTGYCKFHRTERQETPKKDTEERR